MRWIYISPHLDDAVFSAGGLLNDQTRAGEQVEFWTLFCGFPQDGNISPFAQNLHSQWGFYSAEETICARRAEDYRAAGIIGVRAVHFDFPDCIYRRGFDGKWLYSESTFVPPHTDEDNFSARITNTLAENLEPDDQIVCPLAIGGHVDHVIVRRSVENLGRPLWYYADIPYLLANLPALNLIEKTMQAKSHFVTREGLAAWQDGAAAYVSQIPMEFETPRMMRKAIANYGKKGVRLWRFFEVAPRV